MGGTRTFTRTHTFTNCSVIVEIDSVAAMTLFPELAATEEMAAGLAGFIEDAVRRSLEEALDEKRGFTLRGYFERHPIAVVFRRARDGVLVRARKGDSHQELSNDEAIDALRAFAAPD